MTVLFAGTMYECRKFLHDMPHGCPSYDIGHDCFMDRPDDHLEVMRTAGGNYAILRPGEIVRDVSRQTDGGYALWLGATATSGRVVVLSLGELVHPEQLVTGTTLIHVECSPANKVLRCWADGVLMLDRRMPLVEAPRRKVCATCGRALPKVGDWCDQCADLLCHQCSRLEPHKSHRWRVVRRVDTVSQF